MIKLLGFMPDNSPTDDGVITDCTNAIPTLKGAYKGAASAVDVNIAALADTCIGLVEVQDLDGNAKVYAATDTKIYQASGSTWTDVSRVGDYTSGDKRTRFAQFGNVTLAVNQVDTLQAATSGDFADVSGAPDAALIDVAQGFVMLADTVDGTFGDQSDRWWCSGLYDHTDWTPDVATQCTSGRLLDAPGPIRAMRALGSNFVAYKDRAMFFGEYVGPPIVWQWTQIPGTIGCSSQEAVVSIGSAHIFVGYEDFYLFDGSRPVPIGAGIKDWFFGELNTTYRYKIQGLHDSVNANVWFFYPRNDSGDGTPNAAVVYNYKANKWGKVSVTIEAALEYLVGGIQYNDLGTEYTTYNALPDIGYDSPFWTALSPSLAVMNTSHQLQTLNGSSTSSTLILGDVGDDSRYSTLRRVRPRFIQSPSSATMQNAYKQVSGDQLTNDQTASLSDGKFDVLRSARWHRVTFTFSGDVEILGVDYDLQPDGTR